MIKTERFQGGKVYPVRGEAARLLPQVQISLDPRAVNWFLTASDIPGRGPSVKAPVPNVVGQSHMLVSVVLMLGEGNMDGTVDGW